MEKNRLEIPEVAVEAAVNARGRQNNPKWDSSIFGYETFADEQKEYLRRDAKVAVEAAAPYLRAQGVEYAIKRLEGIVGAQKDEAQWKLIFDWLTTTAWTLQYGTEKGEGK